ncbi:MAG: hypothetical protein NC311_07680 [Muribaculaceae bacterium]|nr:hypothetical protein [Muribaculaceae bacterium]
MAALMKNIVKKPGVTQDAIQMMRMIHTNNPIASMFFVFLSARSFFGSLPDG